MLGHIDERKSSLCCRKCSLYDRLWSANECVDRTIGRLSGVDVKKFNAGNISYRIGNCIDNLNKRDNAGVLLCFGAMALLCILYVQFERKQCDEFNLMINWTITSLISPIKWRKKMLSIGLICASNSYFLLPSENKQYVYGKMSLLFSQSIFVKHAF